MALRLRTNIKSLERALHKYEHVRQCPADWLDIATALDTNVDYLLAIGRVSLAKADRLRTRAQRVRAHLHGLATICR